MYEDSDSFLIFSVRNSHYALRTSLIQEIMQETKVYPIPFVPEYVEGLVNCRGRAYTAVNFALLSGEENGTELTGQTYLVFKRSDDQLCLHISNIDLFYEAEEDEILEKSVKYKNREIPFFDVDSVLSRLRKDLGYE